MKKTFTVNINGKIYTIDEDAYALLQDYLSQLRAAFRGDEGAEIVADIESRISEHFDQRTLSGSPIIVIADVNRVIETMGRPEEIGDTPDDPSAQDSDATPPPFRGGAAADTAFSCDGNRKLYRDERHRVIGGVLAGLAQYLNWDVTVLRILVVVIAIVSYLIPCVIIYLIAWMIIPPAVTPADYLRMRGESVTLDSFGQTVIRNREPASAPVPDDTASQLSRFINTAFSLVAKFFLCIFGFFSAVGAFTLCCLVLALLCGIGAYAISGFDGVLDAFDISTCTQTVLYTGSFALVCTFMASMLPLLAIAWLMCTVMFKTPAPGKGLLWTALLMEALFIIGAIVLYGLSHSSQAWTTALYMAPIISGTAPVCLG